MPKSGKEHGEAGKQYEEDVREKTGGISEVINKKEIDSVTNEALIQAKDSESAIKKPKNFLSFGLNTLPILIFNNILKKREENWLFGIRNNKHGILLFTTRLA